MAGRRAIGKEWLAGVETESLRVKFAAGVVVAAR